MTPELAAATVNAQHRISRLASNLPVHRAFHWLHLHQPQLLLWQLEMLAIPAPPFSEAARAKWFLERFTSLGLTGSHIDAEGNVLAELSSGDALSENRRILLSAHLDTVFPAGTPTIPTQEGSRILAPGACDNAAGLTALLAIAAALRYAGIAPPRPILFCANVGEEGEGDLRGMRHLFSRSSDREGIPRDPGIAAAIALEGSGTGSVVTRALGSRRYRITLAGPGGHSWSDAGAPNPIMLISRALAELAHLTSLTGATADAPRTVLSPGQISGGTSINSIPESATVHLDLRSTGPAELDLHQAEIRRVFTAIAAEASQIAPVHLQLDLIGDRPAAQLPEGAPILQTIRAVDRHLGIRTELRLGSTDANIPLSLNIPAVALAAGGTGGGIHTLAEWYDPGGRETALRRILLTVLDLAFT